MEERLWVQNSSEQNVPSCPRELAGTWRQAVVLQRRGRGDGRRFSQRRHGLLKIQTECALRVVLSLTSGQEEAAKNRS
ncbi:hypothetical protein EYF80_051802 [Liparis tanakae]|uniref:Uncharacterized protein n=1 Tax=Liparis tanakae TaxID=230148 RepID=A0A4Z2FAS8_9TELE|nr:hypothetical protein EYF80_051802 [Liparis tanakae]